VREEGHYWVRMQSDPANWTVAWWDATDSAWRILGDERDFTDSIFVEISSRITYAS
jgi:hypothetical protein